MTRCDVTLLVKQSSCIVRKHRTLSLQICVRDTVRLTTEFGDWYRNACTFYTNFPPWYQALWPATWGSSSLTLAITSLTKQLVSGESGYVQAWGNRTSLWTSAKLKPALFRANTPHNQLFSEPPTVYRGKHIFSRHFHRSYLKADKVSKGECTRKVKYAYHFRTCADAADRKLSKLVHACQNHTLQKLARFLSHSVE